MSLKQLYTILLFLCISIVGFAQNDTNIRDQVETENLIPWSIVAFDSLERTPAERIAMVKELGFAQYAFGGRKKHIETMEQELLLAKKENIKISAVWLYMNPAKDKPGELKQMSEKVFEALKNTGLETQIWVGFAPNYFENLSQSEALKKAIAMISYLSERAKTIGCKVALYNHGGWPGDPKNQLEVIKALPQYEIGIVYNFHHAHLQLDSYEENIKLMLPYLWCVSLNGMIEGGPKILTIGQGDLEQDMIQSLIDINYQGSFAILGHVKGGDPAIILKQNLDGLQELFPN